MGHIKLHLGCGKRIIPGFIHIDQATFPHLDYNSGIDDLTMFNDDSVDLIYSSHALEYFDRIEAETVLSEWCRVLKVGGTLRLAVPDFEALVEVYRRYGDIHRVLGPLYGRMEIEGDKKIIIYHKTVYDFASLEDLLIAAGFTDIKRYDWRETVHKDHDDHSQAYVPHMDKDNGILVSLNVESRKK